MPLLRGILASPPPPRALAAAAVLLLGLLALGGRPSAAPPPHSAATVREGVVPTPAAGTPSFATSAAAGASAAAADDDDDDSDGDSETAQRSRAAGPTPRRPDPQRRSPPPEEDDTDAAPATPTPAAAAAATPRFSAYVINLDRHRSRWARTQREWGGRLPLRRMRASVLPGRPAAQSINHSVMRVLATLADNDDPFVVSMEDDAAATPAFDALWPHMLAEMAARAGEWDVIQTGGRFDFGPTRNPSIERVPCSTVFVDVNASTAAQMVVFSRSVLAKAGAWMAAVRDGRGGLENDIFFTVNGARKRELGRRLPQFRVWHPRVSVTTQRSHGSATKREFTRPSITLATASDRVKRVSAALLPPLLPGALQPPAGVPGAVARCAAAAAAMRRRQKQQHAGGGGGGGAGAGAPPPSLSLLAPSTPVLVQGRNSRRGYAAARFAQAAVVALAASTGRGVVLSSTAACPKEPADRLVDFPTLNLLLPAAPAWAAGVGARCAGAAMLADPRLPEYAAAGVHAGAATVWLHNTSWAVVNVTSLPLPPSGETGDSGAYWHPPGAQCTGALGVPTGVGDGSGAVVVDADATDATDGTVVGVWERLRPTPAVLTAAMRFLSRGGVPPGSYVGLHLRLRGVAAGNDNGDDGGANENDDDEDGDAGASSSSSPCHADLRAVYDAVEGEHARLQGGSRALLVATDRPRHPCTARVLARFPSNATRVVASGVWAAGSCREAQFAQEVLAQAGGLVGASGSAFSSLTQLLRRRVYGETSAMVTYPPLAPSVGAAASAGSGAGGR